MFSRILDLALVIFVRAMLMVAAIFMGLLFLACLFLPFLAVRE